MSQNFGGAPGSKSSRAILSTLLHTFGQCRAFYDLGEELSEEELKGKFLNIVRTPHYRCKSLITINLISLHRQVFFCTLASGTTKQITFRPPREEDYLGSYLRQYIFQHLLQRELTLDTILGRSNEDYNPEARWLLTDDDNPLSGWQDEDAPHHWQRKFFDPIYISLPTPVFPARTSVTVHF